MISQTVPKKKVFVGLSGGVDSSVSAALLKEAGYDVTGVFIHVWHKDADKRGLERGLTLMTETGCCQAVDDRLDAMRVCAKLDIPFRELDLEKEYKKEVVDYMTREYRAGKTPNPDVMCNRFIKFGAFYNWAIENGADFVATGHYARVRTREARNPKSEIRNKSQILNSKLNAKRYTLNAGSDSNKDQSYFLWQIREGQLSRILFPVGGMKKSDVRKLAKKFGLITADKKDSQGLCFVGKVDMKEFLTHFIKRKKGKVLNEKREVIGEHEGSSFVTLGERHGFTVHASSDREHALYVIRKDIKKNTITVSPKNPSGMLAEAQSMVRIKSVNWLSKPKKDVTYFARARYRQPLQECHIESGSGKTASARIRFVTPQNSVTPGQSLVLYDGDALIGGGIIV